MNPKARKRSILSANCLDESVTGLPAFDLSCLQLDDMRDFTLPTNLRLGHLAEKVVSELIKSSLNYEMLHENVQLFQDERTIGELDFIIKNRNTDLVTHMEMAYKFYLYDPSISKEIVNNWIGPNRNDSLSEKLDKLKTKQFPLFYHESAQAVLNNINQEACVQALCLLVSLYVPYAFEDDLAMVYAKAIQGYYLNLETFRSLDVATKTYYIPTKTEWGIDPSENETWNNFESVLEHVELCMSEQQAVLCWQKDGDAYTSFFIVWW